MQSKSSKFPSMNKNECVLTVCTREWIFPPFCVCALITCMLNFLDFVIMGISKIGPRGSGSSREQNERKKTDLWSLDL